MRACDGGWSVLHLMVSTGEMEVVGVQKLEGKQHQHILNREGTTVHKVACVVCVLWRL